MIKLVYCITKKPSLTDEEFFHYWEKIQRPDRCADSSPAPIGPEPPPLRPGDKHQPVYDGMAELWFDDVQALLTARQSPEWKASNEDEANFMDHSKVAYFVSEEHIISGGGGPR